MEAKYRINAYKCGCGHQIVTINLDAGVTPMFLHCLKLGCSGRMTSAGYRVAPTTPPTHAWYKPDRKQLLRLDLATRDYCRQGGLMLRELDATERADWAEKLAQEQQMASGLLAEIAAMSEDDIDVQLACLRSDPVDADYDPIIRKACMDRLAVLRGS